MERHRSVLLSFVIVLVFATAPAASGGEEAGGSPRLTVGDISETAPSGLAQPDIDFSVETSRAGEPLLKDGALRRVVAALEKGEEVADSAFVTAGNEVVVEIVHAAGASIADLVEGLGGTVRSSAPGLTLASLPFDRLVTLEAETGVDYLRRPLRVDLPREQLEAQGPSAVRALGEEIAKTNADAWHAAGITGAGVKVGIIDSFDGATWSSAAAAGEVPTPLGTYCRAFGFSCDVYGNTPPSGLHGVAVAEVVHEMAPGADLYLVHAVTASDIDLAVDWLIGQGVDIVTRSLGAEFDGPGDGTGFLADVQAKAVAGGILWLNSAGNSAGSATSGNAWDDPNNPVIEGGDGGHWRATWADTDSDGWLNLNGSATEVFVFTCSYLSGFRWDDWGSGNPTDYDVWIWDLPDLSDEPLVLDNQQTLGYDPVENWDNYDPDLPCAGLGYAAIGLIDAGDGTSGDMIQFLSNGGMDPWSNAYSATQPFADTNSVGGLGVGAIDPAAGTTIAGYSARGPTTDERIKPDITAAACLASFTYSPDCFDGTSAATPVTAGAAALIKSGGAATTPATIKSYLLSEAVVERGTTGPDNTYGFGELVLPAPPEPPEPPSDTIAPSWPDQYFSVEVLETEAMLDWRAAVDNTAVAGYLVVRASGVPVGGVYMGTVIANLGKAARSYDATGLLAQTSYAFWVEAYDAAGNVSGDGPLRVVTTATDFGDTNGNIFHDDISWLSATGITKGCNPPLNTKFCPNDEVTRGQMAAFLGRALGLAGGEDINFFIDDDGSVFERDINRLAWWEITSGCNPPLGNEFCPNDPVIRAQMASFLARALLLVDGWEINYFSDDDLSIHEFNINRLAHSEITKGCNPPLNTLFCPGGSVTRAQMAAFLHRARDEINAIRSLLGAEPVSIEAESIYGKVIVEPTGEPRGR